MFGLVFLPVLVEARSAGVVDANIAATGCAGCQPAVFHHQPTTCATVTRNDLKKASSNQRTSVRLGQENPAAATYLTYLSALTVREVHEYVAGRFIQVEK